MKYEYEIVPTSSAARSTKHPRGAEEKKKKKKKATYLPTYLFLRFFEILRSDFRKYLYGVFGVLMQRNGQERD
jgi:hypothetical protein